MKTKLLLFKLLFLSATLCLIQACNKDNPEENEITMQNTVFDPPLLTIKAGTTVTWTNKVSFVHTVTSDEGLFESGEMKKGEKYSFIFVTPGTYKYHCSHHTGMKGFVQVQ